MSNENQTIKPCGCIISEMEDGTTQVGPCVPCGMMEAAKAMNAVSQIFGAIATRLKQQQDVASMEKAIEKVARPKIVE